MNRRCRGTGDTEALISLLAETYPREDTTDQSRGFPITSIATIDTCELFHRRPPSGFRRNIESALGRRVKIDICRDKYGNQQGQRMIVNRPNLAVLPVLGEYRNDWGCTTYRVDVAVDFHMPNLKSAKLLHGVVDRCGVLKWRSPQTTKSHLEDDDGWITVYWCDDRRARNVILYHKRHDPRIVRLELRFMNSTAVRRAGLMYPTSLEDINPAALFNHHFKLVEFRPEYIERMSENRRQAERVRSRYTRLDLQSFLRGKHHPERMVKDISELLPLPAKLDWNVITHQHPPPPPTNPLSLVQKSPIHLPPNLNTKLQRSRV